jgi:hypothetical protein
MNVSFVSVTQQFNTTSSMGRLTLNVLLSFAQFEREVTGERIRDKIAASKKKGMWMGGTVPLGYSCCGDHKLAVNEAEAATVRTIFNEFLRASSVHRLQEWLRENNIHSRNGNHFFRGPLYTILRNPHYLGRVKHKKDSYPGEHPAIIDKDTWAKVQMLLDDNIQGKRSKARATKESLFTGILFDAAGTRYTPTHANKNGRRYRYYTSQAAIKKTVRSDGPAFQRLISKRLWSANCSNGCKRRSSCSLRFTTKEASHHPRDSSNASSNRLPRRRRNGANASRKTARSF